MLNNDNVYLLTPSHCDTHSKVYAHNESKMLDWKGDIVPKKHRRQILLEDVVGSIEHENKMEISDLERRIIAENLNTVKDVGRESNTFEDISQECDHVGSIIHNVNYILNDQTFLQRLTERAELGAFCMNIWRHLCQSFTIPFSFSS